MDSILNSAIQFRRLMDEIPDKIPPIGYSESHYPEFEDIEDEVMTLKEEEKEQEEEKQKEEEARYKKTKKESKKKKRKKEELSERELQEKKELEHAVNIITRVGLFKNFTTSLSQCYEVQNKSWEAEAVYINDDFRICIKDKQYDVSEFGELLPMLLEEFPNSNYGDLKTLETCSDVKVRQGCDLVCDKDVTFKNDYRIKSQIQQIFQDKMEIKQEIEVRPYKVNVYGPGGHFKPHKDTPSSGFLGTAVLVLYDSSDAYLKIRGENTPKTVQDLPPLSTKNQPFLPKITPWFKEKSRYNQDKNQNYNKNHHVLVVFYADTIHEVTQLQQGYRCTLTFEIYQKANINQMIYQEVNNATTIEHLVSLAKSTSKHTFGILLRSRYVLESTPAWNRIDAALLNLCHHLCSKEWKYEIAPVLVYVKGSYGYDSTENQFLQILNEFETYIYPCSDQELLPLSKGEHYNWEQSKWSTFFESEKDFRQVPFWSFPEKKIKQNHGFVIHEEEGAEYTGNESRPYCYDSLYLYYAVLFQYTPQEEEEEEEDLQPFKKQKQF